MYDRQYKPLFEAAQTEIERLNGEVARLTEEVVKPWKPGGAVMTLAAERNAALERAELAEEKVEELKEYDLRLVTDYKTFFVQGCGCVHLDYDDERLKRAERAELYVERMFHLLVIFRSLTVPVMTALFDRGRDELLLADKVHKADDLARQLITEINNEPEPHYPTKQ